jgi:hypothetical protein
VEERLVPPDERALRLHLESGRFRSGVAAARWRLAGVEFPYVYAAICAHDGVEYVFRFECRDFPRTPATAQLWDMEGNKPLPKNRWPAGQGRFALAFNPGWKDGICLYLPCDRLSIEGHDQWKADHPSLLWDPEKGLCKYLSIIHELLNSKDYGGRHAA